MTGNFQVHIDAHERIAVMVHGHFTAAAMRALCAALEETISLVHARGKRAFIVIDARTVTVADVPSEARVESKKILALPYDAMAIVSDNRLVRALSYVIRGSGQASRARFFRREREAYRWFAHLARPRRSAAAWVHVTAGVAVALVGVFALVGWHNGNQYFVRWLPEFRPINPMGAVGLLVLGLALGVWGSRLRAGTRVAALLLAGLGLAALLPVPVDHLLYGQKVTAAGPHAQLADSAGFSLIAIAVALWLGEPHGSWRRRVQYVLLGATLGLSQFMIFSSMYAHDFIYGLNASFVMAVNLAVGFTIASAALLLLLLHKQSVRLFSSISRIGWLILAALVFVQVATYGAWDQAITRNKNNASAAFLGRTGDVQDAVNQRLQAYVDALHGFKGLFAASDYVDQGEFQSYYNSLNLSSDYPGIRALSFIAKVSDAQLPAFVALHRSDKSLHPGGNPAFAITSKTNLPVHYIATYNATASTVGGTDLGATAARLQAFQKADATDAPVSSGTVQFAASATAPASPGFFITIPVSNKTSGKVPVGFVNAVFTYQDFFANTLLQTSLPDGLNVAVTDAGDSTTVFQSSNVGDQRIAYDATVRLPVADRTWDVKIAAPSNFSLPLSQTYLPRTILFGGQLFAVLIVVIFVLQNRARREAYVLADNMTEDLEHERNLAVANDQKSLAILTSIGDAVFAVNTKQEITLFNPAAQAISGFDEAEALHQPYRNILHFEQGATGKPGDHFIRRALAGHHAAMAGDTVLVAKSGKRLQVADSAAPIYDARRKLQGAIVVFRDISREYELDKAKTEFVSLASHQLRTPLAAINWYGEMLLGGDAGKLTKTQHEYMKEIQDGNRRMVDLVNALLDVSRLDLGKLTNQPPRPVDLAELVDSLEKEMGSTIREKSIAFTKEVAEHLPPATADPKLLRMIVQNLLSNAVKYTPAKGQVELALRHATADEVADAHIRAGQPCWLLSIKDTGYGIPKEQQGRIFAKLFRADNVQRMNVEGTGLGLYIVKEVTEKLGGRVWFESMESVGSTFYVVLPFQAKHVASTPGSGVQ